VFFDFIVNIKIQNKSAKMQIMEVACECAMYI